MNPPETPVRTHRKKLTSRTTLALWLLLGPTILLVVVFILFAIMNLVFNPTFWPTPDTEPFANTPLGITIANVILFTIGGAAALAWLPGIIIGATLLIKRPKQSA